MTYIPRKSIKIAELRHPDGRNPEYPFYAIPEEEQLFSVYQDCLAQSKVLANNQNMYHEAWLQLHLAVECFLKYLFCLIRERIELNAPSTGHNLIELGWRNRNGQLFAFGNHYFLSNRRVNCKDFGHDMKQLWTVIDTLTDASEDLSFEQIVNIMPNEKAWVDARYQRRDHETYKEQYDGYLSAFEGCLNSIFGAIK